MPDMEELFNIELFKKISTEMYKTDIRFHDEMLQIMLIHIVYDEATGEMVRHDTELFKGKAKKHLVVFIDTMGVKTWFPRGHVISDSMSIKLDNIFGIYAGIDEEGLSYLRVILDKLTY